MSTARSKEFTSTRLRTLANGLILRPFSLTSQRSGAN